MAAIPDNDEDRVAEIRARMPASGLFAGMTWQLSPRPLALPPKVMKEIYGLGRRLQLFLRACNEIYLRSVKGSLPGWIAEYLDAGKPDSVIDLGRASAFREGLPRVIRPDLLLGENGKLSMTEIDNLPGGIGLTAWLNKTYSELGYKVIGGPRGMIEGFKGIFDGPADVVISGESGDYRPEMEWMVREIGQGWEVEAAEDYQPRGRNVYRFFELFDLDAIHHSAELFGTAMKGDIDLSALPKAHLEEKLWSAVFWNPSLRDVWRSSLRGNHLEKLNELIPYSWIIDPAPIPHFAVLPKLGVNSWDDVGAFSQSERDFVLKLSGYSPDAWGSRSVRVGPDLPAEEWAKSVATAAAGVDENPWVMQEFRGTARIAHDFWNAESGRVEIAEWRARLCPYYFVGASGEAKKPSVVLGGILATLVPLDKKVIHGMTDGVLVPCIQG